MNRYFPDPDISTSNDLDTKHAESIEVLGFSPVWIKCTLVFVCVIIMTVDLCIGVIEKFGMCFLVVCDMFSSGLRVSDCKGFCFRFSVVLLDTVMKHIVSVESWSLFLHIYLT